MLPYTHKTHPRSRSIKIRVEKNGQVVVTSPQNVPAKQIAEFVEKNTAWIEKTKAKLSVNLPITNDQVQIFGKWYQIEKMHTDLIPIGVKVYGEKLLINSVKADLTEDEIKNKIDKFIKNTAEKYIIPRVHQIAKKMDIEFSKITLRQQKTRWGSCSSNGTLSFNWRLVHYPTKIIDYVIIHELSHRIHMNHSDKFWALVGKYDPQHRANRNWLKKHGMSVG